MLGNSFRAWDLGFVFILYLVLSHVKYLELVSCVYERKFKFDLLCSHVNQDYLCHLVVKIHKITYYKWNGSFNLEHPYKKSDSYKLGRILGLTLIGTPLRLKL